MIATTANGNLARVRHGLARRFSSVPAHLRTMAWRAGRLNDWKQSRRVQREAFLQQGYDTCDKLVVFFIPAIERVTGGVLQIYELHRLTREFFKDTGTDALICWLPGEGWGQHHFHGFDNEVTVFSLKTALDRCRADCELLFHIPEYFHILERFGRRLLVALRKKHNLKINMLNQNIEQMRKPGYVARIKEIFPDLTCTVGAPLWATTSERQRLNIPLHVLPTWYFPDDAPWQPYESKKDLMIVSPDPDPHRDLVLGALRNALPKLEIRVVQGLKYEQYMELERAAKWSLTFGEGLDGFFYGPVLRGGVSFAVRNGTFDLPGFEDLRTVYDSYDTMAQRIAADIRALDKKEPFEAYNRSMRAPFVRVFGRRQTREALAAFYRGELTLP